MGGCSPRQHRGRAAAHRSKAGHAKAYSDAAAIREAVEHGGILLREPFDFETLCAVVNAHLA